MKGVYEACYYGGLAMAILFVIAAIVIFVVFKIPRVFGELTGRNAKKSMKSMSEAGTTKDSVSKRERAKYYNEESGKITVRQAVSFDKKKSGKDDTSASLKKSDNYKSKRAGDEEATEVLAGRSANAYDVDEATEVLSGSSTNAKRAVEFADRAVADEEETDVLIGNYNDADEEKTDVLIGNYNDADEEETDVLIGNYNDADEEETDVLRGNYNDADEEETDVLRSAADTDETTVLSGGAGAGINTKVKIIYNILEVHTNETI